MGLSKNIKSNIHALEEPIRLDTGQSMELIWEFFVNLQPCSNEVFLSLLQLEELASRLGNSADSLVESVEERTRVRLSIVKAAKAVLSEEFDASKLIEVIHLLVDTFEN